MEKIGVGLAGYGYAGRQWHATLIQHVPGLAIRAASSRSEERRAQAADDLGVRTHQTYEALLADSAVDLVVIATPHDSHAAMAIAAAEAGKHVVVDKIMCLSVAEGQAMIAAARRAGVVLSVFQNRRWDSDFLTVQQVLSDRLLGELCSVEVGITTYKPANAPRTWRGHAAHGGGQLRDWGAHLLDQAVQLLGPEPELVFADLQYRHAGWDVETSVQAWLRYPSGVRFGMAVDSTSLIPQPHWYIRGANGTLIQFGRDPQEVALRDRGEVGPQALERAGRPRVVLAEGDGEREVSVAVIPGNYSQYYVNVRDAIRGTAPLAVTAEGVLPSIRLVEAIVQSAETGQAVRPADKHAENGNTGAESPPP